MTVRLWLATAAAMVRDRYDLTMELRKLRRQLETGERERKVLANELLATVAERDHLRSALLRKVGGKPLVAGGGHKVGSN